MSDKQEMPTEIMVYEPKDSHKKIKGLYLVCQSADEFNHAFDRPLLKYTRADISPWKAVDEPPEDDRHVWVSWLDKRGKQQCVRGYYHYDYAAHGENKWWGEDDVCLHRAAYWTESLPPIPPIDPEGES